MFNGIDLRDLTNLSNHAEKRKSTRIDCMARDTTDETALTSVEQLAGYLAGGCKPKDAWRIGTEHEKFPFYMADNSPFL